MISLTLVSALAATTLLSMASAQSSGATPTSLYGVAPTQVVLNSWTDEGCFNTSDPLMVYGEYRQQSRGNCQFICAMLNKDVMAVSDGTKCWCGDLVPAAASKVSDGSCDTKCGGYGSESCGGLNTLWVRLTGVSLNKIPNYTPSATPSTTKAPVAKTSQRTQTVIETETDAASSAPSTGGNGGGGGGGGGGPNKTGIAVGVVVGVLVLVGIIAGVFFFMRHKRRREVEEEFRRQANINSFTAGGKLHTSNSSMTDSRLDPEFMARRASNGSIADNEDYSRRILKVTNA